jgi:mono/diheme cytochrome c family protein
LFLSREKDTPQYFLTIKIKKMKINNILPLLVCSVCTAFYIMSCTETQPKVNTITEKNPTTPTQEELVKRGEYLVKITGCNDCHSPKKMGAQGPEIIPELLLSGYPADRPIVKFDSKMLKTGFSMFYPDLTAAAGPWGVSFAGNLTPDETGLGTWTEAQFKIALTQGKFKGIEGSRMLLPPMPWVNYTTMEDADIKAIFAYLKSIKPVKNLVPQPITPDKI